MKNYELNYLVPLHLSEEQIQSIQKEFVGFIQNEGGVLTQEIQIKKTRLGRKIKGEEEVNLVVLNFQVKREAMLGLEKILKEKNQILNYCLLFKKTFKKSPVMRKRMPAKLVKPKEKKVELKEIEKKLEEILEG